MTAGRRGVLTTAGRGTQVGSGRADGEQIAAAGPMARMPVLARLPGSPGGEIRNLPAALRLAGGQWWVRVLGWYLVSRLVVLVSMQVAGVLYHPFPWVDPAHLSRAWDGRWFLRAAQHHYPAHLAGSGRSAQSTIAFFPLFPSLIRALSLTGLPPARAGVLLATALGAVATVLVGLLGRQVFGPRTGERGALLFALFPGSFVFSLIYSEALALTLAAAALLLAHRRRWLLAGVAAAAASATRPDMLALAPALAVAAALEVRRARSLQPLVAPLLSPLGALAYFAYLRVHTGSWTIWFTTERVGWKQTSGLRQLVPWLVDPLLTFPVSPYQWLFLLMPVYLAVAVYAAFRARLPLPTATYTAVVLLLALTSSAVGPRPRAVLVAFPLALALAHVLPERLFRVVTCLFTAGLALVTVLYLASTALGTP